MPSEIKRVLEITVEVELDDRRLSGSRLQRAVESAQAAAAFAVQDVLLPGSISAVRPSHKYAYVHAESGCDPFKPLDQYEVTVQPQVA